jgi:hypothetical protein
MQDLINIPPLIYVLALMALCTVLGYSIGHREGHSEGYLRGRAIAKALKDQELSA